MAEISAGNLYEMNKAMIAKTGSFIKGKALYNKANNVIKPYLDKTLSNTKYYMMLCHDMRNYTVFCNQFEVNAENIQSNFISEFIDCLKARGPVYDIFETEDGEGIEIWLNQDNEVVCYFLFPYDFGVVNF